MNAPVFPFPRPWEPPQRDGTVRVFQSAPGVWAVEDYNAERGHAGIQGGFTRRTAAGIGWELAERLGFDLMIEGDPS